MCDAFKSRRAIESWCVPCVTEYFWRLLDPMVAATPAASPRHMDLTHTSSTRLLQRIDVRDTENCVFLHLVIDVVMHIVDVLVQS